MVSVIGLCVPYERRFGFYRFSAPVSQFNVQSGLLEHASSMVLHSLHLTLGTVTVPHGKPIKTKNLTFLAFLLIKAFYMSLI